MATSATYLLTWNPGKYPWEGFRQDWEAVNMGFRPLFKWSCGNTKKIAVGDRVYMMRLGWREPITGIFASGWVTAEPEEGPHWSDLKPGARRCMLSLSLMYCSIQPWMSCSIRRLYHRASTGIHRVPE